MNMQEIIRKLTSRKLWLAIAGVSTGIAMVLGANASDIQSVAGAITSLVAAVAYIVVEGRVDAARVGKATQAVQDAVDAVVEE